MTHTEYKQQLGKTIKSMTNEERKTYYRLRYQSHTPGQRSSHRTRSKQWYHDNRVYSLCSVHTNTVRKKYPRNMLNSDVATPALLKDWYESSSTVCPICGSYADSIDHILPLSKGGPHHSNNLRRTCLSCNLMRGDMLDSDFLDRVKSIVLFSTTKGTF